MKSYYRLMLGRKSVHAEECFAGGFVGTDFGIQEDLTGHLPDHVQEFNKRYIPKFRINRPDKSKVAAGLACGALWTVSKGIKEGEIVLSPDGDGSYRIGEVTGAYFYAPGQILPHRRKVKWLDLRIPRADMSEALRNSTGSIGTIGNITPHRTEIEKLIGGTVSSPPIQSTDPDIEDPLAFAMEAHLEAFLVANWDQTSLGKEFVVYRDDEELIGQQYATDAGDIDILAISKDKKRLLVVELKRGRASDVVVGQTLRYMGFVKEQIAEPDQSVEGVIIALEDDPKLRWALAAMPTVSFYRYQVSFKLVKG